MVISTACFIGFGWRFVLVALGWFDVSAPFSSHLIISRHYFVHAPCTQQPWPYLAPPVFYLLTFILAGVLCMAVTAMAGWHIFMIACGETSVESQDHEHYRKIARQRGEVSLSRPTTRRITDEGFQTFINSYDMGYIKNLQLFFNVGPDG